jgi:phage/plasmid-like protein (TIGR03299 family)
MSALVESMFSVRQVPWHREGLVLGDYPGSWAQARELAGLGWDPISNQVYAVTGMMPDGTPVYERIEDWKSVVRSDTGAVLSVQPESYTVIGHDEMGAIIEAVLDQPNARYETAGCLAGGKAVWCLVMLDEPIEIPGDNTVTMPYLAVTTRHDGTGACTLRATAVRIVCMNTFRAAEMEGERTGATFSFRHTANWKDRIGDAKAAVTGARREIADYRELATELIGLRVTARQRELFVREFIPTPPDGIITDRVACNIEEAREAVRGILASETTAGIADTVYGLVQAAGEYLDHVRSARSWESRLNRSILRPEPLKARALVLARRVASE